MVYVQNNQFYSGQKWIRIVQKYFSKKNAAEELAHIKLTFEISREILESSFP